MKWNSDLYDNKHGFVSEYGKGLLEFIPSDRSQTILDLGCGTGTLTDRLHEMCGCVIGIDGSEDMIARARSQYEYIDFRVCDALAMPFEEEFNVVFSNAVFHWIEDHDALLKNIYRALKTNGMLVCEFGAKGNIEAIERAFFEACAVYGYSYKSRFNFQSADNFGLLLENNGFTVDVIYDYDRPTPLKDKEEGLKNWMRQFFASDLSYFSEEKKNAILGNTEISVRSLLWNGKEWVADYRRLRVIAHKILTLTKSKNRL